MILFILQYGRNFYYAQWLSDITQELSRERKKKEEKEAEKEEVIEEEPEELVKETSSRARRAQQRKLNVKKNVPEDVLLVAETKKKKLMVRLCFELVFAFVSSLPLLSCAQFCSM